MTPDDATIAAWADAMYQAHLQALVEDEQRRERKVMEADPFCRINRRAEAERRREREGR